MGKYSWQQDLDEPPAILPTLFLQAAATNVVCILNALSFREDGIVLPEV
jgi:hypothetical protein